MADDKKNDLLGSSSPGAVAAAAPPADGVGVLVQYAGARVKMVFDRPLTEFEVHWSEALSLGQLLLAGVAAAAATEAPVPKGAPRLIVPAAPGGRPS